MPDDVAHYPRYRFPPAIISHAVWLYYRFTLSFHDVEDLLAHRGITVSYESIRHWCETFGLAYARQLRHRAGPVGDMWHLDELFVTICEGGPWRYGGDGRRLSGGSRWERLGSPHLAAGTGPTVGKPINH